MLRLLRLLAVFLCLLSTSLAAVPSTVTVTKHPVQLKRKTFPPGKPPQHLTKSPRTEVAFCDSQFSVVCQIGTRLVPAGPRARKAARITSVRVTLKLEITVWTPANGPRSYLAHEETHREISEHYYRGADALARQLAQPLVGRTVGLPGKAERKAVVNAVRPLQRELIHAYMRGTHERASYAQDRFDAITDHGRARIGNREAMARAVADEQRRWRMLNQRRG